MATPSSTSPSARPLDGTTNDGDVSVAELDLDDARWHDFVDSNADALVFHRPAWAQMLAHCYAGYRPFVLGVLDREGRIAGGLPVIELTSAGRRRKRWVALPFSDLCPPLLSEQYTAEAFTSALIAAQARAQVPSLEVRAPLADRRGAYRRSDAVTHATRLEHDPYAVLARCHRSQVQRNVRRAERERKIVVRRADSEADLTRHFFRLQVQTRRRQGMPVQPRRFFRALWTQLLEPGHGFLLLAYAHREAVAGAVFLTGSQTLTYKYGASDDGFWRLRPNHLLFWNAIQVACEQGYRWLDFGRSDLPDQGLRTFKAGWAGQEAPLIYTTLAEQAPRSSSRPQLSAARAVIRRSPAWVCRASGELLYRYAA